LAEEKYKLKQADLKKEEKKILDARSLPLREYLNDNVVPFVSEGLAEIYQNLPDDPVDFLAEYLFKRSLDVKFPDPKLFLEEN
jgi:adenylate kinase